MTNKFEDKAGDNMAVINILSDGQALVNVFQNAPVAVLGWYIQGRETPGKAEGAQTSVVFNDAFCRLTEYSRHEIAVLFGADISELMVQEDRHAFRAAVQALCEYPHEKTLACQLLKRGGMKLEIELTMHSVRQADGSIWIYAAVSRAAEAMSIPAAEGSQARMELRCFGYFNVLIDGKPIAFQHEKAKELLALLTDRQGKFLSSGEIISCLWEDEPVNDNTRGRCRKAVYYLRETLERYGMQDLIESTSKGYRRLRTEQVSCDLYRYLAGEPAYIRQFRGAYMTDYSWAEQTLTSLMYKK